MDFDVFFTVIPQMIKAFIEMEDEIEESEFEFVFVVMLTLQILRSTKRFVERARLHRITNFLNRRVFVPGFFNTVLRYPDIQFQEDFRMSREQFEVI